MISKQSRELILMAVRLERDRARLDWTSNTASTTRRRCFDEWIQAVNELEALLAKPSQTELFELYKLRNENRLLNEKLSKQAEELRASLDFEKATREGVLQWAQRAQDAEEDLEEIKKALRLLAKSVGLE